MSQPDRNIPIKVLLAKPGLDGHSVGIRVVAQFLRDSGFEVLFLGIRRKNEDIINVAIQESVGVIGLSLLSGAHIHIMRDFMAKLRDSGISPIVVVGGVIPKGDHEKLYKMGVNKIFGTADSFEEIAEFLRKSVKLFSNER